MEINRLERQLDFREKQIERLTAKCSLLQIELSSITDTSGSIFPDPDAQEKSVIAEYDKAVGRSEKMESEECAEDHRRSEMKEGDDGAESPTDILKVRKRPGKVSWGKRKECVGSLDSLEASALIIASLNHELMLLMQVSTSSFLIAKINFGTNFL